MTTMAKVHDKTVARCRIRLREATRCESYETECQEASIREQFSRE
jgi:hypothetical protein